MSPRQPHPLPTLQLPVLLAVHEELGRARVQQRGVQRVEGARAGRAQDGREAEPREVALLLRPVQQPRDLRAPRRGAVLAHGGEDGRVAGDEQDVVDRGACFGFWPSAWLFNSCRSPRSCAMPWTSSRDAA